MIASLSDPEIAVSGGRALAAIRDPRAVPALIAVLDSDQASLARIVAARALGAIGDTSAYEALVEAANDESASDGLRMAARESLEEIDPRPGDRPPRSRLVTLVVGALALLGLGLAAAPALGILALVPLIAAAVLMLTYRLRAAPRIYQHEDGSAWWQIWGGDGGGGNGGG